MRNEQNIILRKVHNCQSLLIIGKKIPKGISEKGRYIVTNLSKVKMLVTMQNPSKHKSIAKSLNMSVAKINKIINHDLQFKNSIKT